MPVLYASSTKGNTFMFDSLLKEIHLKRLLLTERMRCFIDVSPTSLRRHVPGGKFDSPASESIHITMML